ncbi:Ribosomal RNA small subunit methyltransferase NEP1 [Babesia sp. Xinjiang]|uniref:Ribosomal RNA small subunit methyltransferase NEP1 n=1 Tax=Babesia sp. Xinjiang TaxID=462227 RepID=UPI000A228FB1|nr:Ribosomal RNA small subunit methyltransferase NEP1 [Babesia sp. Xinjiang]ORM40350.1 Ribosomal RNA small subunit methyltransferase NEP1 [Babesia sp. Xinjiang]
MNPPKVVVVLEDATVLSTEKESRVDILHQCLLVLLDSPLNKNGLLKVFIRTDDNTLIDVSPHLRVPRTPKQFDSLLIHLMYKRHVKSQEKDTILMRIVKNDLEIALSPGSRRFGLSVGGRPVKLKEFCQQFKDADYPVVFHIGAVSHSQPKGTVNQVEEVLSISSHGLTAAHVCAKICCELELLNGVD